MGNTPAKIGIRLESKAEAGSILKGRVYLSIQCARQQTCGLNLILEGEESVVINTYEKKNNNRQKVVNRDSSVIHRMEVPLVKFEKGFINRGQYEYPFEWPLPADLPSSMICQIDKSSSCEIKYKLTAYLDKGGGLPKSTSTTCSSKDNTIDTKTVLLGASSDLNHSVPVEVALQKYCIKSSLFGNKGSITLGVDVNTSIAAPQGTIHIGITGKNDSTTKLQHFTARVAEIVTCSAAGHNRDFTRNLCISKISPPENTAWDPLSTFSFSTSRLRRPLSNSSCQNTEEEEDNKSKRNRVMTQLTLPVDARDTYEGKFIGIRHVLVVQPVTSRFFTPTSSALESSIHIKVQRRMPPLLPQLEENNNCINSYNDSMAAGGVEVPTPSAPPCLFDENINDSSLYNAQNIYQTPSATAIETATIPTTGTAATEAMEASLPVAVAELLPDGWQAEESEVVCIPVETVIHSRTS